MKPLFQPSFLSTNLTLFLLNQASYEPANVQLPQRQRNVLAELVLLLSCNALNLVPEVGRLPYVVHASPAAPLPPDRGVNGEVLLEGLVGDRSAYKAERKGQRLDEISR